MQLQLGGAKEELEKAELGITDAIRADNGNDLEICINERDNAKALVEQSESELALYSWRAEIYRIKSLIV